VALTGPPWRAAELDLSRGAIFGISGAASPKRKLWCPALARSRP